MKPVFRWSAYNLMVLPLLPIRLLVAVFFMYVLRPLGYGCEYLLDKLPGMRRY